MTLETADVGKEYIISRIDTDDDELNAFLFSLGCYTGEAVTLVSRRGGGHRLYSKGKRGGHAGCMLCGT